MTATSERVIIINKGAIVAEDTLDRLTTRLKKGLIYSMEVKTPSPAGVAALKKLSGISGISSVGAKLVIEMLPGHGEMRDQVIETAVKQGMGVLEFSAERVSLEEIFLQLTTVEEQV